MTAVKTIVDSVVANYQRRTIHGDGTVVWKDQQNRFHCVDSPAIEYPNGGTCWYKHGNPHRVGGPAVTCWYGLDEYWIDGRRFTEHEYYLYVDQDTGEVLVPPGKKLKYDRW
jgi:hypothetical protein